MNTEGPTRKRRVKTQYSVADRKRLVREHAQSGQSKKAFCEQRGINVGTFMGWRNIKPSKKSKPAFAKIEVAAGVSADVEILLPGGARIAIRGSGKRADLVALVRGVAGC